MQMALRMSKEQLSQVAAMRKQRLDRIEPAARAMLAALKHARDEVHNPGAFRFSAQSANGRHDIGDYLEAAIAAAEAAGIKGEE